MQRVVAVLLTLVMGISQLAIWHCPAADAPAHGELAGGDIPGGVAAGHAGHTAASHANAQPPPGHHDGSSDCEYMLGCRSAIVAARALVLSGAPAAVVRIDASAPSLTGTTPSAEPPPPRLQV